MAPICATQIGAAADFADPSLYSSNGKAWGFVRFLKVSGAGSIEVKFRYPRAGAATETFTMKAGETLPGQILALVSADSACFPIKVWP
jgi:hypothetical protein